MLFSEVVLDIETGNPPKDALEKERLTIKIDGRVKDPAKVKEKQDEVLSEGGLLNLAPVACIGMICDGVNINFNTFPLTFPEQQELLASQIFPVSFTHEPVMLSYLTVFLDMFTSPETEIITHNGKGFDVPKILQRSAFHRVKGSRILAPENRYMHFDTMERFGWSFAHRGEEKMFVSLERICASLNVEFAKSIYKSKEIPNAIDDGAFVNVIKYNQEDCRATREAKHAMQLQL